MKIAVISESSVLMDTRYWLNSNDRRCLERCVFMYTWRKLMQNYSSMTVYVETWEND